MKRLFTITAAAAIGVAAWAGPVQVTATVDSVDVKQGALRRVDVEVVQPSAIVARWLSDPVDSTHRVVEIQPGVEINYSGPVDTVDLGNDRLQLRRTLLVQPWDSGEVVINNLGIVSGLDTFRSNPIVLKVYTADVDTMTTVHAFMPEATQPRHFWDWVPDWLYDYWWAVLLGLVAIGAGIVSYILYRKGGLRQVLSTPVKPVPPYEKAITQLNILRTRQLCEKGQEKEYYTELTEILRQYLEGRFGIYAMEMTTPQIKRAVYATVTEKSASAMMNEILEMADYVKFARMRPLPEDNARAFNQAMQFVENTKPEPAPEADGKEVSR